ncbi:uncharacterized protein KNAG_0K00160 [Huiozyma naganishii CBS 8797]|uniref:Phosphatidylglycerophosphatase GEP4, mitochondrial n=1 Tax=Huiozyma naganishii (strain ATCC MYA-139 / BCRC 22969 / CBS 8797 / KCTC 17520 / NBRC 10181 / NCYC 3082 / Yp74L-3) TaxID=1071383 RepID=J7S9Z0_HUIN7|nr:hypothetical protein KNAG_0K00160 [Kazachstania naganishii CBS 8797]CCK72384.1 hypothetical protein KNAG_0K00160 [Kazachstania naganishii CBS 8797]
MLQDLNILGTLNAFKLLYNPKLCKPHAVFPTFDQVPIPVNNSIKAIVLDKDNCFAYPKQSTVWPEYKAQWEKLKQTYPGKALLVVSNTAGSGDDTDFKEAKLIEQQTGVNVLRHSKKKPGCKEEILRYFRENNVTTNPQEIAVIGDRLLTDVMLANMMNAYAVWIKDGVKISNNPIVRFEKRLASYMGFGDSK